MYIGVHIVSVSLCSFNWLCNYQQILLQLSDIRHKGNLFLPFRCSYKNAKSDSFILCVSLSLSVFMVHHPSSHGMAFHEILCCMFALKCAKKIHFWLKSDAKAHTLNEGFCILMILSCRVLCGWWYLQIKVIEQNRTHSLGQIQLLWGGGTTVAQWLRCCATNWKVTGWIPAGELELFIDIKSFWLHHGPGVDSASNRNEYQEYFLGLKAAKA
jgi:hypothetical protein